MPVQIPIVEVGEDIISFSLQTDLSQHETSAATQLSCISLTMQLF